jgi:hypothetical protein
MKMTITHQESYSRGQLLLRSFFGFFYIGLPHGFLLMFCGIWASILHFISFWVILFTGRYPQSFFEYQVGMLRWQLRVNARINNLVDGYPSFFPSGTDTLTSLEIPYTGSSSRGLLLLRTFFGIFYVILPHGFILYFRLIGSLFVMFVAWWAVLFTGKYPAGMHAFNVGTHRWGMRVNAYLLFLTDKYPPFTGKELPEDGATPTAAAGQ